MRRSLTRGRMIEERINGGKSLTIQRIDIKSLGQPRETKPTLGLAGVVTVDMANLGM